MESENSADPPGGATDTHPEDSEGTSPAKSKQESIAPDGVAPDTSERSDRGSSDVSAEEEDPVIHEIPVFVSKGTPGLYLVQYPVRPASMPYSAGSVGRARLRPRNQQLELELAINTEGENYDRSRGEQIKLNVDGSESVGARGVAKDGGYFSSSLMDKQVLQGGAALPSCDRYALGILNDNELHLSPVKGVLALKPHLGYLDRGDRTAKQEGRLPGQDRDQEEEEEEETKPQAVTVKFAKGDLEKDKKRKEKSYDYAKARQDEEPWVDLKFNQLKSRRWEEESQAMFCSNMDEDVKNIEDDVQTYLQALKDSHG